MLERSEICLAYSSVATPDLFFFFLSDPATTEFYTLPLHAAFPISRLGKPTAFGVDLGLGEVALADREIAALGDMSGSDGDPGRHAQALQSTLAGALVREPGKFVRSEERRVGKECRSRWSPYH